MNAGQSLDLFKSSIAFDQRLIREDVTGSVAHVQMLVECGVIDAETGDQLIGGLRQILADYETGRITFSSADETVVGREDIHMNVEALLSERLGQHIAGKLHTARSRNDQVALDMHLFVRRASVSTIRHLVCLQQALYRLAATNLDVVMPGYTHLQRAQPVLLSHHLLAYAWMIQRDVDRVTDSLRRTNVCPLGAAALAGTSFPINPLVTARTLQFASAYENSMDAVSDRDFVVEHLSANALIASHLSRLCEELILWASLEFAFITLDKAEGGSSIMPQKRNPDLAELVRGKTGRVYGALMALLTIIKGTPLAYNKDFQEDKEPLFDSVDTVHASIRHLSGFIERISFNSAAMSAAASRGLLNATDLADYLVLKGLSFREAYHIVRDQLVPLCLASGKELLELTLDQFRAIAQQVDEDVYEYLRPSTVVSRRVSYGGTGATQVRFQLSQLDRRINETLQWLENPEVQFWQELGAPTQPRNSDFLEKTL